MVDQIFGKEVFGKSTNEKYKITENSSQELWYLMAEDQRHQTILIEMTDAILQGDKEEDERYYRKSCNEETGRQAGWFHEPNNVLNRVY